MAIADDEKIHSDQNYTEGLPAHDSCPHPEPNSAPL